MLYALVYLGLDRASVRVVAGLHAKGRDDGIRAVTRTAFLTLAPFAALVAVVAAFAGPEVAVRLGRPDVAPFLRFAAVAIPASLVADSHLWATEGLGLQRYTVIVRMVVEPVVKVAASVALFVALRNDADIGALGVSYSLSIAVSAVLAVAIFYRSVPRGAGRRPEDASPAALLRVGVPACGSNLLVRLLVWSDVFLIFTFVSSEATSHYAVAYRTALLTMMIASAFDAAFKPSIAGALALGRRDRAAEEFERVARMVLMFCLPACVMLIVFPGRVMPVLGDQFVPDAPIVALVAVGTLASFLAGPAASALVMAGHSHTPFAHACNPEQSEADAHVNDGGCTHAHASNHRPTTTVMTTRSAIRLDGST